ncbi:myosin light chain kinase A [Drosophila tropicalis]|uniref:myosin light chain kinase A n=1 Tax=Drosophila tropicalis TaxID=46794 RepID=UPI0035ABEC37
MTNALWPHVPLSSGISHLFRTDGSVISSINDFQNGDIIVCCCMYEAFMNLDYKVNRNYLRMLGQILSRQNQPSNMSGPLPKDLPKAIRLFIDVSKPISRTRYSTVFKGQSKAKRDINYLIKMIQKTNMDEISSSDYKEIQIIRQLQGHANIIQLMYSVEQPRQAFIIKECLDSDVSKLMSQYGPFTERLSRQIVRDVASGLLHLHRRNILHRNIKPENLAVQIRKTMSEGTCPEISVVKISDFSLATYYSGKKLYQCCGTRNFVPPETVRHSGYDFGIDIWGLGVTLFYMTCNEYPFGNNTNNSDEIFMSTLHSSHCFPWPKRSQLSTEIKKCIDGMLHKIPAFRLTIADVAMHPFLLKTTSQ